MSGKGYLELGAQAAHATPDVAESVYTRARSPLRCTLQIPNGKAALNQPASVPSRRTGWRLLVVALLVLGSLMLVLAQSPMLQDQNYHTFADRRPFFGMPNFLDVASNLAFLAVGIAGLRVCFSARPAVTAAWFVLFFGVALVSIGSAHYHWMPSDRTLVWDRLPMTIGFMGLLAALVGEHLGERWGNVLLIPLLLLGVGSVMYWVASGDLRFYYWVQFIPLMLMPFVFVLYRPAYSHRWMLLLAIGLYGTAKVAEAADAAVLLHTGGIVSGHTLKHLLSALACLIIVLMLVKRKWIGDNGHAAISRVAIASAHAH